MENIMIKRTMFVFIFVSSIGLENWSDNSHEKNILHQQTLSSHPKTNHSYNTKETVKNVEASHSFIVVFFPYKVWHWQIRFQLRYVCIIFWVLEDWRFYIKSKAFWFPFVIFLHLILLVMVTWKIRGSLLQWELS